MSRRAALPKGAVTITPGYSWRLDLDIVFSGDRPSDWAAWEIRMHIWTDSGSLMTLKNGHGVTYEPVSDLPEADEPVIIPVIRITAEQSSMLSRGRCAFNYAIDLKAPEGDAEDYFYGMLTIAAGPPLEMLR